MGGAEVKKPAEKIETYVKENKREREEAFRKIREVELREECESHCTDVLEGIQDTVQEREASRETEVDRGFIVSLTHNRSESQTYQLGLIVKLLFAREFFCKRQLEAIEKFHYLIVNM